MSKLKNKKYGKYKKDVLTKNHVPPQLPQYGWGATIGAGAGLAAGALIPGAQAFTPALMTLGSSIGGQFDTNKANQQDAAYQAQLAEAMKMQAVQQNAQNVFNSTYRMGGKMCYPMGGVANAEIEKEENVVYPNGETQQFSGPSHEQGGIPVNLPNGTDIFSDRLKVPGEKKTTFAEAAKKFRTDKFKKILDNPNSTQIAKKTAEKMFNKHNASLDSLFDLQERLKYIQNQKAALKTAEKGTIEEFRNGGRKIQNMYALGGETDPTKFNPNLDYNTFNQQYNNYMNTPQTQGVSNQPIYPTPTGNLPVDNTFTNSPSFGNRPNVTTSNNPIDYTQLGLGAATTALNALGPASYLMGQGQRYDKVNYPTFNPNLIDYSASLRDADRNAVIARQNLANAAGGNSGAYLANTAGVMSQNTQNKANIRQAGEQANTGIKNQIGMFNMQNKIAAMNAEAANKGQALTNKYAAISNLGENLAGSVSSYNKYRQESNMDKMLMSNLKGVFPNFNFDDKNWRFNFVKTYGMSPEQYNQALNRK